MRRGVFLKLMGAFLLVIVTATVAFDLTVRPAWEASLRREIERAMIEKTRLFAQRVANDRQYSMPELVAQEAAAGNARATVIDKQGRVLADSEANPESMENHAARPEFATALRGEVGMATRESRTLGISFLYVAAPVPQGAVRMAYPLASVRDTTATVRRVLLIASAVALLAAMLISAVIAHLVARRLRRILKFAERIAAGDLSARIMETRSDEIATVAATLDHTARELEQSFAAVETHRRQLETLLNSMQEAVVAVGADGRVLWANDRLQQLVYHRLRIGMPLVETIRDPDLLVTVEKALEQNTRATTRVTSLLPARTFEVTVSPMPPAGAVAVLHDLTALERVEKTRRDFIANVSHELRTPLTSVQGYAETLLDSMKADGDQREFVEIILKNAARMSRLTQDLLVLARVESGEQRFDLEPVPACVVLQNAVENLASFAREIGVDLVIEESVQTPVAADLDAIDQVLSNLIRNALNYGASGGRVSIGARNHERGVEFYVRDFGAGIASEHLPRLFERFYRVDKARSRETGGTGLGLAIVKHIVRAHGGDVRVDSQLGQGSTFYFTLPTANVAVSA